MKKNVFGVRSLVSIACLAALLDLITRSNCFYMKKWEGFCKTFFQRERLAGAFSFWLSYNDFTGTYWF